MLPPSRPSAPADHRIFVWGEWLLVIGLMAMLVWTTLGLGGYLAATMVVTSRAVFALAALGGLLWAFGRRGRTVGLNWAALLPVPFLLYALFSVLCLAPAQWLAWREWLLWLQMWLVFGLVLHFGRGRKQTAVIVATLVGLALAGVGLAAYQRFADRTWLMLGRTQAAQFFGRSSGMFGIPNSLAGLLELMIPACLTLLASRATRPAVKIACAWLAALFVFALVLTGSRGGWIALALALMLWPLLAGGDWRRRLAGFAVILTAVIAAGWLLFHFNENVRARLQPFVAGQFEASRPVIWKAGWKIWRDHPWWGSGAGSYNLVFDQYRARGFLNEPNWTHNDYLNTLSDYGLAGFALWVVGGAGILRLGWLAVRRTRRESTTTVNLFGLWKWRLGLFVGLLAFAFHLFVDFHTKIPALAFLAAVIAALLVRDDVAVARPIGAGWTRGLGLVAALASVMVALRLASPLYRAEAFRYDSRRAIDKYAAAGRGDLGAILPGALANFKLAVKADPTNGQAWADLSYALSQNWQYTGSDLLTIGRRSELAADQALALCDINAEFWVRKGVAVAMQSRLVEAEGYFQRALQLAPTVPVWWYYYAYHLAGYPDRKEEALRAVETCLTLDPSNSAGIALRQQLVAHR